MKSKDSKPTIALALANLLCKDIPADAPPTHHEVTQFVKNAIVTMSSFHRMLLVKYCQAVVEEKTDVLEKIVANIATEGVDCPRLGQVLELLENKDDHDQHIRNMKAVLGMVWDMAKAEFEETSGFENTEMEDIHLHAEGATDLRSCFIVLEGKTCFKVFFDQTVDGKDLYEKIYKLTGLEKDDIYLTFGNDEGASVLENHNGLYAWLPDGQTLTMKFRMRGGGKTTKKPAMMKTLREKVVTRSASVPVITDSFMNDLNAHVSQTLQKFESVDDKKMLQNEMKGILGLLQSSALTEMLEKMGSNHNKDTKVTSASNLLFGEKTLPLKNVIDGYKKALDTVESAGTFILCKTYLADNGNFEFSKLKDDINAELGKRQIREEVRTEMGGMTN